MTEPIVTASTEDLQRDAEGRPCYRHRPKLIGGEIGITLEPDALVWSDGTTESRLPLHQIAQVRLVFRPANLYTQRYMVQISQRLGKTIWFANLSYRGMVEVEATDRPFSAFVRELLPRIAAASPKARFLGGEPAWRYGLVGLLTLMLMAAAVMLAVTAIRTLTWPVAATVLAIAGYIGWQMTLWLIKNKPSMIAPRDPPASLLP